MVDHLGSAGPAAFRTSEGALEILTIMQRLNPSDRFTFTSIYEPIN